jgi:predicted nucleotide-binding protein
VVMRERFEGAGEKQLIEMLARQEFAGGNVEIAKALKERGELLEFANGTKIIAQDGEDNDIYLLVAGSVAIVVNKNHINTRKAGEPIGEMAAIEPTQMRAADCVALETVVALKVSSANFFEIGKQFPQVWLPIAQLMSRRLFQRNKDIPVPNEKPKLFIISSVEALEIAQQVQLALQHDVLCTVWTDGVFFASSYPIESLEKAVEHSDFAVAIAQADDIITDARGQQGSVLRDNVIFELGLFMGRLSRHRTILVHPKKQGLKLPSDFHGLTMASFEPGPTNELSARLGPACTQIRTIVKNLGVRKFIS